MHCAMASAWTTNWVGPTSQPARQPGMACDLDRLLMVTTWSGNSAAKLGTRPPGASPAYTSSATTHSECRRARSPITANSAALRITPLGLFGVAKKIARVAGVTAASSAAKSTRNPFDAGEGTRIIRAPDTSRVAG